MSDIPEAAGSLPRGGTLDWLRGRLRNIAPFATLIALVAFFSAASESFATWGNVQNILTQISVTGIIAVGLTFVILCAEIDLSVASIANATGIVVAYFTVQDASVSIANIPLPGWAAIVIALAVCFALGAVNAFGLTRIGIPSFIMTLAMLQLAAGICAMLVRGQLAYSVPPLVETLGSRSLGPVPWIVIVTAVFLLVGHVVLTYTRFGRYVYMTGGNREAAEYSGVNVRAILSAVMIISAVCSGVAGMLGVAYFGSAQQNEFDTYLLDSISAVVVGGTSLFGGQGGIGNTIIGLFVLGVLNNGLDHINIDSFLKILIRGLILLIALIGHVNLALLVWVLGLGLALPVTLTDCLVLVPPVVLVATLPISIAGWGAREVAMITLFGLIGIPATQATALSVLFGLSTLLIALPGGLLWLLERHAGRPSEIPGENPG